MKQHLHKWLPVPWPAASGAGVHEGSRRALITHQTPVFLSWRGSLWVSFGFSVLQYWLFWEFTSPCRENQVSLEKDARGRSMSLSCKNRRNRSQKCILTTGKCSFKAWTTCSHHSLENFVALHAYALYIHISSTSHLRVFLGENSNLGPMPLLSVQCVFCLAFNVAAILLFSAYCLSRVVQQWMVEWEMH